MSLSASSLQQLLQPLSSPLESIRKSPLYFVGLGATAVFVVLMPLLYVSLIAAVTWACFWHLGNNLFLWGLRISGFWGALIKAFLYLGPALAGFTMVGFMIKPLLAKFEKPPKPRRLEREEAPEFFALVDSLTDAIRAPRPVSIHVDSQVNASASFENGVWGMLRGRLVLTVGLPLLQSLNTRELSGILAHEFGHFAQGGGMRLSFVVRTLNFWFQRIVQHRDAWDAGLDAGATESDVRLGIFFWLAKGFVWVSRQALWLTAGASNFVCMFLLRQMEYDADRYESRVAGARQFAETAHRLRRLNLAWQRAGQSTSQAWADGKLPHNFFSLLGNLESRIGSEHDLALRKSIEDEKPSLWRTHPLDRERNARALQAGDQGLVTLEVPCRDLFAQFEELATESSREFYGRNLEQELADEHFISTESVVATSVEAQKDAEALARVVGPFAGLVLPLKLPSLERGPSQSDLRAKLQATLTTLAAANAHFDKGFADLCTAEQRNLARNAGYTGGEASELEDDADTHWSRVGAAAVDLRTALEPLSERLVCAVQSHPSLVPGELGNLLAANQAFVSLEVPLQNLAIDLSALDFLARQEAHSGEARDRAVKAWVEAIDKNLVLVHSGLETVADPLASEPNPTLAEFLFPEGLADSSDHNAVFQQAKQLFGRAGGYYSRLLARLCRIVEEEEARQGLEPMAVTVA